MNFWKSNNPKSSYSPKQEPPQLNPHQALTSLPHHFSGLFNHIAQCPLKAHLQSSLFNLQSNAKHALESGISSFNQVSCSGLNPVWARITVNNTTQYSRKGAMSYEAIAERLSGVPVYALSNVAEEFVLVSGASTGKSLGLFCFKKEDADALLEHIQSVDPGMRSGSKVVALALNKVFHLKVDGVAFRFIPDSSQVKNAVKEREKTGFSDGGFTGVPVFQSRSLILRSQNKTYRPVFFRKEDLVNSLQRASSQQNRLNPALKQGEIEVAVLEEVIKGMKVKPQVQALTIRALFTYFLPLKRGLWWTLLHQSGTMWFSSLLDMTYQLSPPMLLIANE